MDPSAAMRVNPLLGRIESVLIDVIGGVSLKSARGGWRYEWQPPRDLIEVASRALEPLSRLEQAPETQNNDAVRERLERNRALLDELRLRKRDSLDLGTPISEKGLAIAVDGATRFSSSRKESGQAPVLWIMEDMTLEKYSGRRDAPFWSAQGARTFQAVRLMLCHAQGHDSKTTELCHATSLMRKSEYTSLQLSTPGA